MAIFLSEWYQETAECVELAKKAGIADDRIILDPGVGFGKTYEQNLTTIKYMDDLKSWAIRCCLELHVNL